MPLFISESGSSMMKQDKSRADEIDVAEVPNARQNMLDPTHFVATKNISASEEIYLEYLFLIDK